MSNPQYSVIVPVFNSEKTLEELNLRIHKVLEENNFQFEIIYIEDGSSDSSWSILKKIKLANPGTTKAIKLAKNFGQHNATFCGLEHASGDILITIDDDLQIQPEEIVKLIESKNQNEADLVYGFYKNKQHSIIRNLGSRLLKRSSKFFNNSPGEGSSFRLFTKDISEKILSHSQNFVFIDELLLWYTDNINFVKVEHLKRKELKSGYTSTKLFKLTINLIIYYSALPLKIMTYGGFLSSAICFLIGVYYIVKKVFFKVPAGYTSIIVTILFSTSIIIFSLGIIGEYLNRIYMVQNKKPPYSIKKII